jgi:hypothetical protein
VRSGATLELIGVQIISNPHPRLAGAAAVRAAGAGTRLLLQGCTVHGKRAAGHFIDTFCLMPVGVVVQDGAEAKLDRCCIEWTRGGVLVTDFGSAAQLAACVVGHCNSRGYIAENAAVLKATRCIAFSNGTCGFWAVGKGTVMQMTECISVNNRSHGLSAVYHALVLLDACVVHPNGIGGVIVEVGAKLNSARTEEPP